jgi:tRNA uracil 4-sulfurtransferase
VIQTATSMPILRPLVGMDKNEIIVEARKLGTFETSILPDEDCCTLFTPPHPETRARPEEVEESESRLEIDRMVNDALAQTEVIRLSFPKPPA